jgi:hypothetical protein
VLEGLSVGKSTGTSEAINGTSLGGPVGSPVNKLDGSDRDWVGAAVEGNTAEGEFVGKPTFSSSTGAPLGVSMKVGLMVGKTPVWSSELGSNEGRREVWTRGLEEGGETVGVICLLGAPVGNG